jgi:hypothetical protein
MDRTAYFVGEKVPFVPTGLPADAAIKIVLVDAANQPAEVYSGPVRPLWLDTAWLAPGDYRVEIGGQVALPRLTITGLVARSAASLQDESPPRQPRFDPQKTYSPDERRAIAERHWDAVVQTLKESGLSAVFSLASADTPRQPCLDALARTGTILLANPDTRPTSFFPTHNAAEELDGMSQRVLLAAQANGRYPNFAGFCYGWDTTGFAVGGRKGLMTYWGWGDKTAALRSYIARIDQQTIDEFVRRTGLRPVTEAEYISYLASIHRPEFAPAIDLPTKMWLEEIARHAKPLDEKERAEFEKRLDAWSAYLMGMYAEVYGVFSANLRSLSPSLRCTASVQVDHTAVRFGQYFPQAYAPLDFQYQSTWNDQVGGPDYAYQWLLTQSLLEMHRGGRPTWISNALAAAHGRAAYPGKFMRVAAHGLAHGATGVGFACEAFSNVLGGMNSDTNWENMKGKSGAADLVAGRDFLDRFAALAVEGQGAHPVGILFSRSQFARQHIVMGYGVPQYKALVALTRLGYSPCFVTEEDFQAGRTRGLKALVVLGQTFPLPPAATAALAEFAKAGGRILVDGNTTEKLPAAEPLGVTFSFTELGKPHSWTSPNIVAGDNDTLLYERWHADLAPALAKALGATGRGILASDAGAAAKVSLMQIGGGQATYVIAINDSHVATQADWHAVREKLVPTSAAPPEAVLYDCTEEKPLGKLAAMDCDLSATTARVFAVLPKALNRIDLSASQKVFAGGELVFRVGFLDDAGQPIRAVLLFHVAVRRPDGKVFQELYRATGADGDFAVALAIPVNTPSGDWSVTVRSQLDGATATLPVSVQAATPAPCAAPVTETVVVRGEAAIDGLLARGRKLAVPVFDSPEAPRVLAAAEKLRDTLVPRGVEVEIIRNPALGVYTVAYDLSDAQKAENAKVERGELFGRIKRDTVNGNDWAAVLAGWRFGRPVILFDLVGVKDNPVAESAADAGLLWPAADAAFPGAGKAVVHGVRWMLGPRVDAIVIQAADAAGLLAGAAAMADLPEDRLTPGIEAARAELWRQRCIGGRPARPAVEGLTSHGLKAGRSPSPLAIQFPDARPPSADAVRPPARPIRAATAVPAAFGPKQFVSFMPDGDKWVEAGTADRLVPDLRFSAAILLVVEAKQGGKVKVVARGLFRYSDAKPCWQAQWEDIIDLREKLVPKERRPMAIDVLIGGKPAGRLVPSHMEQKEVPLELASPTAGLKPKTAVEEVVTEFSGDVELPAGRQEILLVHRHVVDGKLDAVGVGMSEVELTGAK